jgi:hypothetical protein
MATPLPKIMKAAMSARLENIRTTNSLLGTLKPARFSNIVVGIAWAHAAMALLKTTKCEFHSERLNKGSQSAAYVFQPALPPLGS